MCVLVAVHTLSASHIAPSHKPKPYGRRAVHSDLIRKAAGLLAGPSSRRFW